MNIDWAALGTVFGVSLVATVALVGLFTLGIVGLSKQPEPAAQGGSSGGPAGSAGGSLMLARAGAYVCFGLCAAAVAYGIYLIVA
ncbi:hypothetical protein OG345_31595 [Streptomyces sp. NBC_01220]|uniref:Secreted protein n=1 Tax=Streptomyces poriferorum TaxID=2798799 RepID=A0ABY9J0K2_9ACTN|nr:MULTISPECIES: hypothetical protein [Streptomyces]WSQ47215.1 hypothetical protein OG345_31595 [Streptomyces sp. NBC_01220]MBW5253132.1 hypothetical protein [Streptomyces poriferorum]MBW5261309.1 hypothetical protein [Streptomyces poriferorum]MDP5311125.1 hypothetical protein [Streptomyces sp. Alt4]WLQ59758.1 hypothetical protein P8A19_31950 [Streptomyces sp. Alt2]